MQVFPVPGPHFASIDIIKVAVGIGDALLEPMEMDVVGRTTIEGRVLVGDTIFMNDEGVGDITEDMLLIIAFVIELTRPE